LFEGKIKDAKNIEEIKKVIENGSIARCNFCSVEDAGIKCAEIIEKRMGAEVRGTRFNKEKSSGKCAVCGSKANHIVYIAKSY
jgi:rubrerythrin